MRANYDVIMLVMNGVESDSRVLRTARSVAGSGLSLLLIGLGGRRDAEASTPPSLRSEPFDTVLVPAPTLPPAAPGSDEQAARHRELLRQYSDRVLDMCQAMSPRIVHTHDMTTIATGARLKRHFHEQGRLTSWIHDLHEWVGGLTTIAEPIRRVSAADEAAHIGSADVLTTVSPAIARIIAKQYALAREPTVVLNTPALSELIEDGQSSVRAAIGLSPSVPLAVYAGQVKEARGVHDLVAALRVLPDLHVALISNNRGPYIDRLLAQSTAEGTIERLHLLPYVGQSQVASFVHTADIGVHPLARYGNGDVALPNKLFEYIHASLPVVVSDCATMAEFVQEHGIGQAYEAGNVGSLATAIRSVLERRDAYAGASRSIRARYSWEEQEKLIHSMYAGLLDVGSISVGPPFAWPHYGPVAATATAPAPPLRVLHGVAGSANQPWALAAALRARGHTAHNVVTAVPRLGFRASMLIPIRRMSTAQQFAMIRALADEFDVFHFHARSFLFESRTFRFPTLVDLLLLRLLGKVVVFHFRGSEARLGSAFSAANPFSYAAEDPYGISSLYPEDTQRRMISFIQSIANAVFVTDPELQGYVPGSEIIPRAIDLDEWRPVLPGGAKRPLVVHAPTRPALKGTDHLLRALDRLRNRGVEFDFIQATDLRHDDARDLYRRADVIVDQLLIGWYGVLAVEGMALAKPVVSYVRPDLVEHLGQPTPIALADPSSVEEVLSRLLTNAPERRRIGELGRAYVERVHASSVVAETLEARYRTLVDEALQRGADYDGLASFFELQAEQAATTASAVGRASRVLQRTEALLTDAIPLARRVMKAHPSTEQGDDAEQDARAIHTAVATGAKQVAAARADLDRAQLPERMASAAEEADADENASAGLAAEPAESAASSTRGGPARESTAEPKPKAPEATPWRGPPDLQDILAGDEAVGAALRGLGARAQTWEAVGQSVARNPSAGLRLLDLLAASERDEHESILDTVSMAASRSFTRSRDTLLVSTSQEAGTTPGGAIDIRTQVRFARHFYNLRRRVGADAEAVGAALLKATLEPAQGTQDEPPTAVLGMIEGPAAQLNDVSWFFINSAAVSRTLDSASISRYDAVMRAFASRTGLWEVGAFRTTRSSLLASLPLRLEVLDPPKRGKGPTVTLRCTTEGTTIAAARTYDRLTGTPAGIEASITTRIDGASPLMLEVRSDSPAACRILLPEFTYDPTRSSPRTTEWRAAGEVVADSDGVEHVLVAPPEYLAQSGNLTTFKPVPGGYHSRTLSRQIEQMETLARLHAHPAFDYRANAWRSFAEHWAGAKAAAMPR